MPITVHWYDEAKHIIIWNIGASWSIDEFYTALDETKTLASSVHDAATHVIVDAQAVVERPQTNLLPHFRHALSSLDLGTVVYLRERSGGLLIEMLVNAVLKMTRNVTVREFKFAKSLNEAMRYIEVTQSQN